MIPRLIVKKTGVLMSIQDLGRLGYRRLGVPWSGVLQPELAKIANALAGNSENTAVLEFFMTGPTLFLAEGTLCLAIAGDCLLNMTRAGKQRMFRPWRSVTMQAGDTLQIGQIHSGKAGYIAVAGGFPLAAVLGSHSTYARGRFGGLDGEIVSSGACLPVAEKTQPRLGNMYLPTPPAAELPGSSLESLALFPPAVIRVIPGPQDDYFTKQALRDFLSGIYTVNKESDRMGIRLEGPLLEHRPDKSTEIVSDGMVPGAIQVPGSGAPIVMLADGPTVGGYPKIATVISADLPKLAVMTPGSRLCFSAVTVEEAENILSAGREHFTALLATIAPLPKMAEPF